MLRLLVVCLFAIFHCQVVLADQFHYFNVLLGSRAAEMGGAYTALGGDASAIYFNPAGLATMRSSSMDASANGFFSREVRYKNLFGDVDFVSQSNGNLATLVGGAGSLSKMVDGLYYGWALYSPDAELKDQDSLFVDKPKFFIKRFHISDNLRASTSYKGGGVAYRLGKSLTTGIAFSLFDVDELTQTYQNVHSESPFIDPGAGTIQKTLTRNIRERLVVSGLMTNLGLLYHAGNLSLGMSLKIPVVLSEKFEHVTEEITIYHNQDDKLVHSDNTTDETREKVIGINDKVSRVVNSDPEKRDPLGNWPIEMRFGVAWQDPNLFTISFDVAYHSGAGDKTKTNPSYVRQGVMNYFLGSEFIPYKNIPVRLGLFTNNDARERASKDNSVAESVDYVGGSFYVAYTLEQSEFSVGIIYQSGTGTAHKAGGKSSVQDVEATSRTFGFAIKHML